MAQRDDVFSELNPASFRNIEFPIIARSISFAQQHATHKFVYRPLEFIEGLGPGNFKFSYTIPFRQGIFGGPYVDLYVDTFPRFLEACRDRTQGDLFDPVLGTFRARPVSFSTDTDVLRRDGEDIQVEFIHSPDPDEVDILEDTFVGVESMSSAANVLARDPVFREELPDEGDLFESIGDAFNQINAIGSQINNVQGQISGKIDKISGQILKTVDTVERLVDVKNAPLIRSMKNLQFQAHQFERKFSALGSDFKFFTTPQDMTISAVGQAVGHPVQVVVANNPKLASSPLVRRGIKVKYPVLR